MGGNSIHPFFSKMALVDEIISGVEFEENDLANPVYTWEGADYPCVPSIAEFQRTLDTGGFTTDRVLTMTARLLDESQNGLYPSDVLPEPQQIITYSGDQYRIISTKKHPTGAYLRVIAHGINRGI